jgi:hypothetical protein
MNFAPRKLILLATAVSAGVVILWVILQPSLSDRLEYFHGNWCVEQMQINGRDTVPVTTGITLQFQDEGICSGNISMDERVILFPGLNTIGGNARWAVEDDSIRISLASPEAKIFEGKYSVDVRGEVITLISDDVYIRARVVKFRFPF